MMEDEHAAYNAAFNAEFERLGGKKAQDELDEAANALEAIWDKVKSGPLQTPPLRKLRNAIILDDE
jgi:predicted metal-dependent hydrolase